MKRSTSRKSSTSIPRSNGTGHSPSPLVQFAADRAHDAADALYEQAKESIDRAQNAIGGVHVDNAWQRLQPMLVSTAGFVRQYPLRAAMVVALLASAFWITRTAETGT
ncbi:hypothetical protein DFR24_2653 [Panacagrimonas perspica]|uniref:Uncharacterized protein n=1 Tax=Panacagrimonas perspica TaxID=381431 RepID=A0A4V3F6C3_9GAMM|nr:hypothetical protein [Panacagrimonas perspica]TDU28286.1 hypothetical protein DFR24_2653 [Panacagrimonas perspica]